MVTIVHVGRVSTTARIPATERQKAVYDWIVAYRNSMGYIPSYREIANRFGFRSTNAVTTNLRALERKGYLRLVPGKCRAIVLL
jgi:repressor LexA